MKKPRNRIVAVPLIWLLVFCMGVCSLAGCRSSQIPPDNNEGPNDPLSSSSVVTPASSSSVVTPPSSSNTVDPSLPYIIPDNFPEISIRDAVYQAPVLPIPEKDASEEEWLAFFHGLLSSHHSWYNKLLAFEFSKPEEINLKLLISNGILNANNSALTSAETAYLKTRDWEFNMDTYRTPKAELEALMQTYLGTTLKDSGNTTLANAAYFEETGCYYMCTGAPLMGKYTGIVSYRILDNGDYCVRYYYEYGHLDYDTDFMEVVLRPQETHFTVISNLPAA